MSDQYVPRVGDKVRLLGWAGMCEGLTITPHMRHMVGRVLRVVEVNERGLPRFEEPTKQRFRWWWPASRLELVERAT